MTDFNPAVGDPVYWRNLRSGKVAGSIEVIDETREDPFGVRLVNGNFKWSKQNRLERRETYPWQTSAGNH